MDGIFNRFFSFDKLIATGLIKFMYWAGIIGIALFTIGLVIAAFGAFKIGFLQGLVALIMAPVAGVVSIVVWRFICEVYLVIFGIYDRLGNIQTAVGGGPAKDISSVSDAKPS